MKWLNMILDRTCLLGFLLAFSSPSTVVCQIDFAGPREIYFSQVEINAIDLADMDGDGDQDILLTEGHFNGFGFSNNQLLWLENDGEGQFGQEHLVSTEILGGYNILGEDVDGDGDTDIYVVHLNTGGVVWFEQITPGVFDSWREVEGMIADMSPILAIDFEDMDNDDDLDFLPVNRVDEGLVWYVNNGQSSFQKDTIYSDADFFIAYFGTAPAYLSDPDLPDILVGNYYGPEPSVQWFRNLGNQSFAEGRTIGDTTVFRLLGDISSADLDGNGHDDIVLALEEDGASEDPPMIAYIGNDGNGDLTGLQPISNTTGEIYNLLAVDLNGDERPDLIYHSYYDLLVQENTGGAVFTAADTLLHIESIVESVDRISLADLDGDGDLDVVAVIGDRDVVVIMENLSPPVLTPVNESLKDDLRLRVFPNPSAGVAKLDGNLPMGATYHFTVSDVRGVEVRRYEDVATLPLDIDCRGLSSGIYFVHVYDAGDILKGSLQIIVKELSAR